MGVRVTEKWIRIDTENPDHWSIQSIIVKRDTIVAVTLHKKVEGPGGCDNGIKVVTKETGWGHDYWIRYKDFAKAEADYQDLVGHMENG